MTKIKASITAGIRPSAMILHEQPTKPWKPLDFLILEAYQILEDERCGQCGLPVWLCHNGERDLNVRVLLDECEATRAVSEYEERNKEKLNGGERARPEFYSREDIPLHRYRRSYYEALAKERAPDDAQD